MPTPSGGLLRATDIPHVTLSAGGKTAECAHCPPLPARLVTSRRAMKETVPRYATFALRMWRREFKPNKVNWYSDFISFVIKSEMVVIFTDVLVEGYRQDTENY